MSSPSRNRTIYGGSIMLAPPEGTLYDGSMVAMSFPDFRDGSVLATSFTGTLTERCGKAVERIPVPLRLADWLAANGLAVDSCAQPQLDRARELRESIHAALTAVAEQEPIPSSATRVLNDCSTHGQASAILTPEGMRKWQLGSASVDDALSVIAADAISIIAGERDGRVALCASPTCRAAFFDTSRSRTRKWCDMGTCGNREKKARFLAGKRNSSLRT